MVKCTSKSKDANATTLLNNGIVEAAACTSAMRLETLGLELEGVAWEEEDDVDGFDSDDDVDGFDCDTGASGDGFDCDTVAGDDGFDCDPVANGDGTAFTVVIRFTSFSLMLSTKSQEMSMIPSFKLPIF